MRYLAIVALFCLLAVPATAVEDWDNWMSMVWDPYSTVYDFNCEWVEYGSFVPVTLWLVRPVNPDFGGVERDVQQVSYFDVKITMTEGLNPVGWTLAAPGILNVGADGSMQGQFDEPQLVVDDRVALAICDVFVGDASFEIPEEPWARCVYNTNAWTSLAPASIGMLPGSICYIDAEDQGRWAGWCPTPSRTRTCSSPW